VSYDALFDSAWAKWAQGVRHVQALQDNIAATAQDNVNLSPALETRTEYDAKRHGFIVIVERVEPVPLLWRLMLGDAASNFRACLDHLAWALVLRGRTPPGSGKLTKGQENAVYFPISQNRADFNAQIVVPPGPKSRPKLPGVRRTDAAKVRAHQPYHQGAQKRPIHVLTMLAGINTGDKHRTTQPLWVDPSMIHLHVQRAEDCEVRAVASGRWRKRILEPDTELIRVAARRTGPNPQLEVQVNLIAQPSIGKRVSIEEWGTRTPAFLVRVLTDFCDPPQKLIEPLASVERLATTASRLEVLEDRQISEGLR
jgi:hypothetical protein